jgi:protein-S-isoprenylcysteine O-methyltransferase Ste14
MSIKARLILQNLLSVVICGAMLFVPAGTFAFWQGWVFMALLFLPGFGFTVYFYKHDPALVERRLQGGEKVPVQKLIIRFAAIFGFLAFLVPGFDYRFGWSRRMFGVEPLWLTLTAVLIFLPFYLLTYWVMQVNSYASRTIQVAAGQQVVTTGPYRIVRHPMYFGALISLLAAALVLGSYLALPAFALVLIPTFVFRIFNEEQVLRRELAGYAEYCERTRYRLVPFIW